MSSSDKTKEDLYHIPDSKVFTSATVIDENGTSIALNTLFTPLSVTALVFVRHWGCAACAEYVEVLSKRLGHDELAKYGAKVIIVGHGKPSLIANYRALTGTNFHIYTSPDKEMHKALGFGQMTWQSIFTNPIPAYSDKGNLTTLVNAIKNIPKVGPRSDWGDDKQLGGEYIIKTDEHGESVCTFGRRMPNSRDHTTPDDLLEQIRAASRT